MFKALVRRVVMPFLATALLVSLGAGVADAAPYGSSSPGVGVSDPGPCSGSSTTLSGSNFAPGQTVTITVDGGSSGAATAGANGSFTQAVNLSAFGVGAHTVTASGSNGSASASAVVKVVDCSAIDAAGPTTVPAATANGNLAYTGAAVVGLGLFAGVALVVGLGLVLLGRRRA